MASKGHYFLALIPPAELREAIRLLKEEMKERFHAKHALKSPAHITLQMPFKRKVSEEAFLLEGLTVFASRQTSFSIDLSGFDCFAPRVIFIKIEEHEPIVQLHERLNEYLLGSLGFSSEEVNSLFHPHLTIATRDLRKSAFRAAWAEFEKRAFHASFEARSLFLLKHNGRFWENYREFLFE